jgi:hypothetical protein
MANIINGTDTGSGGLITTGDSSDELQIQTAETTAITVDSGQRTKFPTTIGVGDATPSASGSGISFPATQSASSDANTLDDYEEGTWTPTIFGASTAGTATGLSQLGFYTKIGNLVTVSCIIGCTSTTGTGELRFGGLPFIGTGIASYTAPWVDLADWGDGTYLIVITSTTTTTAEVNCMRDNQAILNQQIVNEPQTWRWTVTYRI